jgi:hypothetical protein
MQQPQEDTVNGQNGYLFDLSVNHYFQFVTEDGKLDEAGILEAGYNPAQVPMIEAVLVKAGKLAPAPVIQPAPQPAAAATPIKPIVPATPKTED